MCFKLTLHPVNFSCIYLISYFCLNQFHAKLYYLLIITENKTVVRKVNEMEMWDLYKKQKWPFTLLRLPDSFKHTK